MHLVEQSIWTFPDMVGTLLPQSSLLRGWVEESQFLPSGEGTWFTMIGAFGLKLKHIGGDLPEVAVMACHV